MTCKQGLVKGALLCFRNLYFYFWHGESTSTASQLTSPASQKSKDLNKFRSFYKTLITLYVDTWVVNPLTIETILPVVVLSMVVLVTIPAPGVDKEID